MILIILGFVLSFIGAFVIMLEGGSIQLRVYYYVLIKGVYEYNINNDIIKKKLTPKEIRVFIWIILMFVGFAFQIAGFFI
jgi:hypothetical protein